MQQITVLCVGRLKEPYLAAACAEYQKRLQTLCKLQIIELPPAKLPDDPAPAQIAQALEKEGAAILEKIPQGAAVVALCVEGKQMDSEAFSRLLSDYATAGKDKVCFVIGGSFGLSDAVKRCADRRLSVSEMTFPHQLFRVMLLEQIYRAKQIERGSKYHK
ncbi:MAG: 23S rRNA (pseudouridine(1915)-N(3))-methyltransferase RlmH [Clostridia bacterium]|nr:23S rRNA (pseudouridine(1915)-N(3))-methyltransferase RlmH [Clostridia bacterium]